MTRRDDQKPPFTDEQPTQQWASMDDFAEAGPDHVDSGTESLHIAMKQKKRHIWPLVVTVIVACVAAIGAGFFWYFQSHALPGVTLWGHSVTGKSQAQIQDEIEEGVAQATIPVSYDGEHAEVSLKDLGLTVNAKQIAQDAVNAKRSNTVWERYSPWEPENVDPTIDISGVDPTVLNEKLNIQTVQPVNASLQASEDGKGFTVTNAVQGTGANPVDVAHEAVSVVESLGTRKPQTVNVKLSQIEPAISDAVITTAQSTLQKLVDKPLTVKVGGHSIGSFNAQNLMDAAKVDPAATAKDDQVKVGNVVFSADKFQQAYEKSIKDTLSDTKKDQSEIVNNDGDVLEITDKGHDGVKIADGADTHVGADALKAIQSGSDTINVDGTVDPMNVTKTKRHVVVDLSDHKVYAYENGKLVNQFWMSAGQGNDYQTGVCQPSGDLCTEPGDYKIWLKYDSQNMSGNLTLSDGSNESWDVKDVGFVNYFSKSGCAIHRIASKTPFNNDDIRALGENTSHGCVGIGWDVAQWFYNWALMGTTVHVQV
ncbi:L,D-transpeptidase [Bifidobacterium magnum]|uniref:ErfK/YbiS/YcfS/YnhG protein n=1 Tax=Bifidobacterium magnum TaxID=1692 RepID=A0A087BEB3_9BIFI|nr:L,D-transpeptidase [Bifidobacterium magnum]KFI69363.1 ErfK/YbiS/YcfS/YnhG protein [Bifidobacterium magnum]